MGRRAPGVGEAELRGHLLRALVEAVDEHRVGWVADLNAEASEARSALGASVERVVVRLPRG